MRKRREAVSPLSQPHTGGWGSRLCYRPAPEMKGRFSFPLRLLLWPCLHLQRRASERGPPSTPGCPSASSSHLLDVSGPWRKPSPPWRSPLERPCAVGPQVPGWRPTSSHQHAAPDWLLDVLSPSGSVTVLGLDLELVTDGNGLGVGCREN